jgi:hypothetical protein
MRQCCDGVPRRKTRTIPLDGANVVTIRTSHRYGRYLAYEATMREVETVYCYPAAGVSKDKRGSNTLDTESDEPLVDEGAAPTFMLDGPEGATLVPPDEDHYTEGDVTAEFLFYHQLLGHPPPATIRSLAKQGMLPARLRKCPVPICTSCLYGKAKKKPWHTKPTKEREAIRMAIRPGECTSMDQMVSATPGLIAQMRGISTTKRYKCITVFVDQATGYGFTHAQKSTSAEETIAAKEAFEMHLAAVGVMVSHYHADNGVFADNGFREACRQARQRLTFCSVNAHFQNGVAERRIGSLTSTA